MKLHAFLANKFMQTAINAILKEIALSLWIAKITLLEL